MVLLEGEAKIERNLLITSEEDILTAMSITRELARITGFPEKEILFLQLATEEACTNAFEYSDKQTNDPVKVTWSIFRRNFELIVTQRGSSFSLVQRNEVNIGLRGRGLQLISHLMDEVRIEPREEMVSLYMKKSW